MHATYHTNVTDPGLRRRASLMVLLVVAILAIAWCSSAGVARAAGARAV